jgi:hypothetical protein
VHTTIRVTVAEIHLAGAEIGIIEIMMTPDITVARDGATRATRLRMILQTRVTTRTAATDPALDYLLIL